MTRYPRLLAFLSGTCGALALPPFFLWPLAFVSYGSLISAMLMATKARQAFWHSWWWGLGFFLSGLYWISISLTVDMERFGWMIPFELVDLRFLLVCK